MKINFEQDSSLNPNEIKVTVSANNLSPSVVELIHQVEKLQNQFSSVLPIKLSDQIKMIQINDIIAVEVFNNQIIFHTIEDAYSTNGQLKRVMEKLNPNNFVQISRSVIINIDMLEYLEAGFSGNLTAFLDHDLKFNVSRKFVPELKAKLRM